MFLELISIKVCEFILSIPGGIGMINRFVKKQRHKIYRIKMPVIVNNAVSGGNIQVFNRGERNHICRNEFFMVFLPVIGAVAIGNPVGAGAVDDHGIQPPVKIIELKPF